MSGNPEHRSFKAASFVTDCERAGLHVCRPFPVGFFKDADSHVAPPSDLGTAVGAGDNAPIGRMCRDGESIAATLAAPEGAGVRVRLDWFGHDTASILVSRTTAGEEWLNVSVRW